MTNLINHTPGPWRVKDNGSLEGPHVYGPVHPVDGGDYAPLAGYKGGALSVADARLIAAAPELLDAALLAYERLLQKAETCRNSEWKASDQNLFDALQNAIWKAQGRTP